MPWVLLSLMFIFPPAAIVLFFGSIRYSLVTKIGAVFFVGLMVFSLTGSEKILLEYQQNLWIHKFFEARRKFRYRDAEEFLRRIPLISSEDQLGLNLLSMGHLLGLGEYNQVLKLYDQTLGLFQNQLDELGPRSKRGEPLVNTFEAIFNTYLLEKDLHGLSEVSQLDEEEFRPEDAAALYSELTGGGISGGMAGLLEYALFLKHDREDSRRLLTHAVQLFFLIPDGKRGSIFNLEFYFLAYLIHFGSEDNLLYAEKNWQRSLETELSEFVNQSPYHLKAYDLRGALRARNGNWQGALEDWIHVFKIDVSHFSVYDNLIQTLHSLSRAGEIQFLEDYKKAENIRFSEAGFEKALDLFGKILTQTDEVPMLLRDEVYFNMGVIYRNNTLEFEKAVENFEQILALPDSFRKEMALYNLAMCHFQLGQYDRCQETIKRLLKEFPTSDQSEKLKMILLYAKSLEIIGDMRDKLRGEES